MKKRFNDKVAIVTGGASGIGLAVSRALIAEGAKVLIVDINAEGAERLERQLGKHAKACCADVSSEVDWKMLTDQVIKWRGKLDLVCNVAGIGRSGSIEDIRLEDWDAMIAVNLTGTMLGCKHGVRAITESNGNGAIINMSSVGGLAGTADLAAYNMTKAGVVSLTKSVALHCAVQRYPIRCISIHPTFVDSEMLDPVAAAAGIDRATLVAGMTKQVPVGRVAKPEDIANAVLFAASEEASMISGSSIIVDGAQLAGIPSGHPA